MYCFCCKPRLPIHTNICDECLPKIDPVLLARYKTAVSQLRDAHVKCQQLKERLKTITRQIRELDKYKYNRGKNDEDQEYFRSVCSKLREIRRENILLIENQRYALQAKREAHMEYYHAGRALRSTS